MTKQYNFDEIVDRKGSFCVKHDMTKEVFGTEDLIPMWVADMDFKTPDFVLEAIQNRCRHEVLGYTYAPDTYIMAVLNWMQKHYHIASKRSCIHFIPGIVQGIALTLQAFTQPGDKVLITTPVYPPFLRLPVKNGRPLCISKLKTVNGRFAIDFDDLAHKANGCKIMILANPHNPGGTVWTKEELQRIADICAENHVLVIADEIHADLTLPGYTHTSFSTVSETARENSITFLAPSKTFNMAGLGSSVGYVPNEKIRRQFFDFLDNNELSFGNIFAFVGAEAAFAKGEEWRQQLLTYLQGNIDFVEQYLKTKLPQITMMRPAASFLLWLDFRKLGLSHEELVHKLAFEAKVGFNSGLEYGDECEGFMRMNIGTSRAIVKEALDRMRKLRTE